MCLYYHFPPVPRHFSSKWIGLCSPSYSSASSPPYSTASSTTSKNVYDKTKTKASLTSIQLSLSTLSPTSPADLFKNRKEKNPIIAAAMSEQVKAASPPEMQLSTQRLSSQMLL